MKLPKLKLLVVLINSFNFGNFIHTAYSFIIGKDKTFKNILSISYLQNSNIGTRISNLYTTLVVKGRINIFVADLKAYP